MTVSYIILKVACNSKFEMDAAPRSRQMPIRFDTSSSFAKSEAGSLLLFLSDRVEGRPPGVPGLDPALELSFEPGLDPQPAPSSSATFVPVPGLDPAPVPGLEPDGVPALDPLPGFGDRWIAEPTIEPVGEPTVDPKNESLSASPTDSRESFPINTRQPERLS